MKLRVLVDLARRYAQAAAIGAGDPRYAMLGGVILAAPSSRERRPED